jgi:hypothetical protein
MPTIEDEIQTTNNVVLIDDKRYIIIILLKQTVTNKESLPGNYILYTGIIIYSYCKIGTVLLQKSRLVFRSLLTVRDDMMKVNSWPQHEEGRLAARLAGWARFLSFFLRSCSKLLEAFSFRFCAYLTPVHEVLYVVYKLTTRDTR